MTEFRRLMLASLLFLIGMMLFNAWEAEHAPTPVPATATSTTTTTPSSVTSTSGVSTTTPTPVTSPTTITTKNQYVQLKTNVIDATIDRVGGTIVNAKLLKYPVSLQEPNTPTTLFSQDPKDYYVATSGVISKDLPPANQMIYQAKVENNDVVLTYQNAKLLITKTYSFSPDDYLIQVKQSISNISGAPVQATAYAELQRKPVSAKGVGPFNISTFLGGVVSSPKKRYEKLTFKDMSQEPLNQTAKNGWLAMVQHYFLSAWVPTPTEIYHYYTQDNNNIYTLGMQSPQMTLQPQQTQTVSDQLYVGPEIASDLAKIAPGLNLTVDYGILWFIAVMIFAVLKEMYKITGNWGWSIVLVTLFIKILFYKLNSISFRSMANMRALQPRIEQIRLNCGDDKQKLGKATMELYKREKINPLGGCLPLLVQIPVFLSLYWVIMESVQLRQAPFIFWIHDLSIKDPYYILPILMGITIFIQQMIAPKAPDPMQRKLMMAMPFIFTALFLSFPAGLVLYWVVNNTLSISQQYYIMNHVVPRSKKKKEESANQPKTKKTKKIKKS
ncbi:MAG TPA: membrane protein insertase YidC [Gammaproteobacteria bacterium]|nr:membrane protein insertase YidC [Gammaproteobacteria bacterium]